MLIGSSFQGRTKHIMALLLRASNGPRGYAARAPRTLALACIRKLCAIELAARLIKVLVKNDNSPVSFPVLHPYGHVVYQAQRGDVHTVLVNGKVVKYDHKLVGVDLGKARQAIAETVDYLKRELGPEEWEKGMHPEIPAHEALANPYTYREGVSAWKEEA